MAEFKTRIILKNDSTANWLTHEDVVLLKGEVGIEFLTDGRVKMKVGDGTKTWAELTYVGDEPHVFEATVGENESHGTAIARVAGSASPIKGDIAIVKELISGDKYQNTAYIYNGNAWAAMDGNYSAENVYFDEDFTFTKAIGTVTIPSSGSKKVAAAGKNLKEFFAGLFAAEQNPTKTDPSVTVTLSGAGTYEVGTVLNPSFTATFEDGKYTYGPEPTGAAVTSWAVTSAHGEEWDEATGTCEQLTVSDGINYFVTAKATHSTGNPGKTNIGNDSTVQIAAGTKSGDSGTITGYRSFFYGVLNTSSADAPLTSSMVRNNLTNGGAYDATKNITIKVNGNTTAKRIVVAIPNSSTRAGVTKVMKTDGLATEITAAYIKTAKAVAVEGVNSYTTAQYDVWVYEPASIDSAEVHEITLG